MQYGNPNIGDQNTTSYTVSGLSGGTTYYFQVRAGNGCAPGDFSNEVAFAPSGATLENTVPSGFTEGVLGDKTDESKKDGSTNDTGVLGTDTNPTVTPEQKLVGGVLGDNTRNLFLGLLIAGLIVFFWRMVAKKSSSK